MYGCGIAFPEQVTDRVGNVELAVGLFKFLYVFFLLSSLSMDQLTYISNGVSKSARRMVPQWIHESAALQRR